MIVRTRAWSSAFLGSIVIAGVVLAASVATTTEPERQTAKAVGFTSALVHPLPNAIVADFKDVLVCDEGENRWTATLRLPGSMSASSGNEGLTVAISRNGVELPAVVLPPHSNLSQLGCADVNFDNACELIVEYRVGRGTGVSTQVLRVYKMPRESDGPKLMCELITGGTIWVGAQEGANPFAQWSRSVAFSRDGGTTQFELKPVDRVAACYQEASLDEIIMACAHVRGFITDDDAKCISSVELQPR
jgi:hypothetical protein